jgi:hypothetical protein
VKEGIEIDEKEVEKEENVLIEMIAIELVSLLV